MITVHKRHLLRYTAAVVCAGLVFSACSRPEEKRYELKGKIVSVDRRGRTITVAHEAVPGFMEAMTMPFRLAEKDQWAVDAAEAGGVMTASLVVAGERSWLESPVISQERKDENGPAGKVSEPMPGEEIGNFTLLNQDGEKISLHDYRQKALLLTFIYTRCPLPDYCPLMTTNFAEIDAALKKSPELYAKTHLLSISVDPEYDRPAVLREYGRRHNGGQGFEHWEYATGTAEEIKKIATSFGLYYTTENEQIVHNLQTALIAPDGKLARIYRGNEWKAADIISDLQNMDLR